MTAFAGMVIVDAIADLKVKADDLRVKTFLLKLLEVNTFQLELVMLK